MLLDAGILLWFGDEHYEYFKQYLDLRMNWRVTSECNEKFGFVLHFDGIPGGADGSKGEARGYHGRRTFRLDDFKYLGGGTLLSPNEILLDWVRNLESVCTAEDAEGTLQGVASLRETKERCAKAATQERKAKPGEG